MGKQKKSAPAKAQKKKTSPLPVAAAVILCLAVALTVLTKTDDKAPAGTAAQVLGAGESLVIPADEVTGDARFYPVEVDGTEMEIIAVRDASGTIRTAFNTCQVCFTSGRGYYVQDGDALVCQNCGSRFTVEQVEIESGGCNPWPIFPEHKTVTEDAVTISYDDLKQATEIFSNWKASF